MYTGNTLDVQGAGNAAKTFQNFEDFNFVAPETGYSDKNVLLHATGAGGLGTAANISFDMSGVSSVSDASLNKGESVTLMQADGGITGDLAAGSASITDVKTGRLADYGNGTIHYDLTVGKNAASTQVDMTVAAVDFYGNETGTGFNANAPTFFDYRNVYGGYGAGDVSNNTLGFAGGTVSNVLAGGYSTGGAATGNTLNISGGTIGTATTPANVYGGYSATGAATGNTLNIRGGTVNGNAYGGFSNGGGATTGNTVNFSGGTVSGTIFGGNNGSDVSGNTLNIAGTANGLTAGNIANFSAMKFNLDGAVANSSTSLLTLNGGAATDLNGVQVEIAGDAIDGDLEEGSTSRYRLLTNASGLKNFDNSASTHVTVNTKALAFDRNLDIQQGDDNGTPSGIGNNLWAELDNAPVANAQPGTSGTSANLLASGDVSRDVAYSAYGAYSNTGTIGADGSITGATDATGGNIVYSSGTIGHNLYGGYSFYGAASGNRATLASGTVNGSVAGGVSYYGDVTSNTAIVNGGTVAGNVYGGYSERGAAGRNSVAISGGTFTGNVYGGYARAGAASYNTVEITGGTFQNGASNSTIYGGYAGNGDATHNTVTFGGTASITSSNTIYGGYAANGNASYNTVNLNGGTINSDVYGGYSNSGGETIHNIVNLYGGTAVNGRIYGGNGTATTGNTLNVNGLGISATDIGNFSTINFILPSSVTNNSSALTLTGTGNTDLRATDIYAGVPGNANLSPGDTIYLITKNNGTLASTASRLHGTLAIGVSLRSDITVSQPDATHIVATVDGSPTPPTPPPAPPTPPTPTPPAPTPSATTTTTITTTPKTARTTTTKTTTKTKTTATKKITVTTTTTTTPTGTTIQTTTTVTPLVPAVQKKPELLPQTESLVQPLIAETMMVNGGANMLTDVGAQQAHDAAELAKKATPDDTMAPFLAMQGTDLAAKTGSHVNVHGINAMLGFAREFRYGDTTVLLTPLAEYGKGDYTSYASGGERGDGEVHYAGAGYFAKQTRDDGVWMEGSLRGGRVRADYKSYDLKGYTGTSDGNVHYDTAAPYFAAHFGVGRTHRVDEDDEFNVYGRYFYSHISGDDVHLSSGEDYHFEPVNSHRLRIGGRWTHHCGMAADLYAGVAYEHEFAGEAVGYYRSLATNKPKITGNSVMVEVGYHMKPKADSPWTLGVGITGWAGRQQGVTGNLRAGLKF